MDILNTEKREAILAEMATREDERGDLEIGEYLALKNIQSLRDVGAENTLTLLTVKDADTVTGFAQGIDPRSQEIRSVRFAMTANEFKLYERMFLQHRDDA